MAYKIEFHPEAETELDEAMAWYESQKEGLSQDFFDDYNAVENRLKDMPEQFQIVEGLIRRANLSKFPFSIFFVIKQISVFIFAVFHQKRNPKEWADRT
jgi:plasmid stabilization system protein ParE